MTPEVGDVSHVTNTMFERILKNDNIEDVTQKYINGRLSDSNQNEVIREIERLFEKIKFKQESMFGLYHSEILQDPNLTQ